MTATPRILTVLLIASFTAHQSRADWPTHRANLSRTGNTDNVPGPTTPNILWTFESSEHFLSPPVVSAKSLYISGLGAFNTASFHALSLDPSATTRELWKKSPPYVKQPTVCPPAIFDGHLIFGDGMHQTDGATLHCLTESGTPLWQLSLPGTLVHLEGSPTMANGRAYIGAGAAGVLCIDINRLTLNGKPTTLANAQSIIEKQWKEMLTKYERDKKLDPDFTIPPDENALPRPAPTVLWQQGKDKWHVDSSLAVTNGLVFVPTAFLDHEKTGLRALLCLDEKTGATKWSTSLKHNPWSGPTISNDLVLIGSSSIRLDPKEIPSAKGEVLALSLSDGSIKWRKDLPGGVVSPIAASDNSAIFTCTDGHVRSLDISTGNENWSYSAGSPFFAGPALAGLVYVADLSGTIHALDPKTAQLKWKLNPSAAPLNTPGQIYGSPAVDAGRLYLATSNLDAQGPAKTLVICIGSK